jgi:four helix bundle protein
MTNLTTLPHEGLFAYRVARELVVAVRAARISDSGLRDQALRAAMSVCLNIAEASGRPRLADQRRVYGNCARRRELAGRAYALLMGLMRSGMK